MLAIATTFLILGFLSTGTLAAPTRALAANDLLKNAQDAQDLNTQFSGLKLSDSCSAGEQACVQGKIAKCGSGGTWAVSQLCTTSESCFALPSLRETGTNLTCTSQANALSLMKACGTTGIARSSKASNSSSNSASSSSHKTKHHTKSSSTAAATVTVTQFIPINSGTVTTSLAPSTITLAPADASSLIASIIADSRVVVSTLSASATHTSASTSCTSSWTKSKMKTKTTTTSKATSPATATSSETSTTITTSSVATSSTASNGANAITSIATSVVTLVPASS